MNKVFRFDTEFIKDAVGVHDFVSIIEAHRDEHILLLISCLGNIRSLLEKLTESYFNGDSETHAIFEGIL